MRAPTAVASATCVYIICLEAMLAFWFSVRVHRCSVYGEPEWKIFVGLGRGYGYASVGRGQRSDDVAVSVASWQNSHAVVRCLVV